ncbi:TniQ family protein [Vibrio parahaemolyticus]|nr:TniQ family protein [Vibrio parahaemolyticus]
MLPIHPQPQKNEILSSWITRLAVENGYYSHAFFKKLLEFDEVIFCRDVDRLDSPRLIKILAKATGKIYDEIDDLKISTFQGEVFEKLNLSGNTRWILPLGIYHRTKRRNGMVYCPLCLREDKIRYFRKSWRLAFITLCHKHQCILWDHCHHCKATVDYQRLGIGSRKYELPVKDLGLCYNCHKPLWNAPVQYLTLKLDLLSTPYRKFLVAFNDNKPITSQLSQPLNLQVFNGLWVLVGRIMSRRATEVRARIFKETGIDLLLSSHRVSFEYLPIEQRRNILITILYYMEDWPIRFIDLVRETKFTLSTFTDNTDKLPFWLSSVIHQKMNLSPYVITDEEIISAINHLKTRQTKLTKRKLANLLGIHVSSLNNRLKTLQHQ